MAAHKLRSFFMMLGTLIGVAALIVIMAAGDGAKANVMSHVRGFGSGALMVNAGGGRGHSIPQEGVVTLTLQDADAIRARVRGLEIVASQAVKRGVSLKAGAAQTYANVIGVEPSWHAAWDWPMEAGRAIAEEDLLTMARVCEIGATVARELFGGLDPIGQPLQLDNVRCQVVGVLATRGTSPMGGDMDNRVVIPLTTALRRVFNQEHLTSIRVKPSNPRRIEATADEIRALLHERHHITPPAEDDFAIVTEADVTKAVSGIEGTLTRLLASLAGLSLLVGGIVLMNILLLSVNQRRHEIGLRRALGARRRDVFHQFLTEALAITLLGLLLGTALGWAVAQGLTVTMGMPVALTWQPVAIGTAAALAVGLGFGIHPALRAARLDPIKALA
jgi:putative ABC transport system permease protein